MNLNKMMVFLRLFIWFSFRQIQRHRAHAAIVLLGIALGSAVFTSVRISVSASLTAYAKSMDVLSGQSDMVIVRPGGTVPDALIPSLFSNPIIHAVAPFSSAYVRPIKGNREPFLLVGIAPILDRRFRSWQTAKISAQAHQPWTALIAEPNTILVSPQLADAFQLSSGDVFLAEHANKQASFHVLGHLAPEGLALAEGGRVAITDMSTFQELTGTLGHVDRIDLKWVTQATPEEFTRLQESLPSGLQMVTPASKTDTQRNMIKAYEINLSVLSFASLFVGMYLIYSLVGLNAASRRHEIAVLGAIGTSPKMIFYLFLGEGLLFGFLGWLTAIPISTILVKYLLTGVSRTISLLFVRVAVSQVSLNATEIAISFCFTLLIAAMAAVQPAREAMRVSPKASLTLSAETVGQGPVSKVLLISGILLIGMVLPLARLPAINHIPVSAYAATIFLFCGFSLLSPWLLHLTGGLLVKIFGRLAGISGYLAGRYIHNSGTRTAISVGALITAVALFAALTIMVHSFRETVRIWTYQTISGDLFVGPKMAEYNNFRDVLPQTVVAGLKGLQTQVDLVPNRRLDLAYAAFPFHLEILDITTFLRHGDFFWISGDSEQTRNALMQGRGVLISEVFANHTQTTVGDQFRMTVLGTSVDLPVVGIVRDYRTHGGVVFCDFSLFNAHQKKISWSGVRLYFKSPPQNMTAAISQLTSEIVAACGHHLDITDGRKIRAAVLTIFDQTFAVTKVLLLIALSVATLGIATTLAIVVLERSRQWHIIFAVGGALGQIRSMILWEALQMVLVGEVAGILCGFFLSYLLVFVINRQSFGWTFVYQVDWGALFWSLPLILLTALIAAIPAMGLVFKKPPATILRD